MNRTRTNIAVGFLGVTILWSAAVGLAQGSPELTLTQAVTLAVANSHDVALARVRHTVAENQARLYRVPFLPNVDAASTLAYSSGFPAASNAQTTSQVAAGSPPPVVIVAEPPSLFQLNYSEAIFNEPLRAQSRAQEERARGLEVEIARARDDVIVRTATAFLELGKARHAQGLLHNESASAQKILEYTQERSAAGMESPIEVTRSELTEARIQQHMVQLDGQIRNLTDQLQKLTGLPPDRLETISTEGLPETDQLADGSLQSAVEENPILKEIGFERNARQDTLKAARKAYLPTVDLIGQYNLLAKFSSYDQFFRIFPQNSVGAGVAIRIPVFSPRIRADVALAKSQLSEVDLTLAKTRDDADSAVKQGSIDVADRTAALSVARLELKLAQENLALLQSRFDQGQATLKEVEQARLDEGEKWLAFLDSDFARQQAELALMKITGRLSEVFK